MKINNQIWDALTIFGEENDRTSKLLEYFHKGLECYHNQKWDEAISFFEKSNQHEEKIEGRKTNPSLIFIQRTEKFKEQKLPKDWDGVYSLESK